MKSRNFRSELGGLLQIVVFRYLDGWRRNKFSVVLQNYPGGKYDVYQILAPVGSADHDESLYFYFNNEDEVRGFIRGIEQMVGVRYLLFERREVEGKVISFFRKDGHFSSNVTSLEKPRKKHQVLRNLALKFSLNKIEEPHIGNVYL
jgi:hypothetical protein